jgi:hypothetical protein
MPAKCNSLNELYYLCVRKYDRIDELIAVHAQYSQLTTDIMTYYNKGVNTHNMPKLYYRFFVSEKVLL